MVTSVLVLAIPSWADDQDTDNSKDQSDIVKRIGASANVLNEIMSAPDKAIPNKVLSDARCIAIVPSMVKIALMFGGNHGKGIATCRTDHGWSAPAPIAVTGGSFGLQLGGQAVDVVMLVMNEKGMNALLSSKFKLGADASAAAGPIGRDAAADTDWKMKAEVLTYSRARGIFAGVDLSGAAITQDKDETRILYGKMEPFKDILYGDVRAPQGSDEFLQTLAKYAPNTPSPKQGALAPEQVQPDRTSGNQ
ncbi:MAG TPA: lipid-binding SYLF domain-containing protein [Terriglobales bacterium]|nr:lipid-binding SYLF domain-containing protein [Terriglobales bacterium]